MPKIVFAVHDEVKKKLDKAVEESQAFSTNSEFLRHWLIKILKDEK